jgi:aspartyl aminopeptidase
MEKKANKVIEGENLDVLVGSAPLKGTEKDAVKANVLKLLKKKYDISEEDFISAEIEVVPAGAAREAGLDRSMIMSYGQDDRVCAYTSLAAMLETDKVSKTTCCLLTDKEEIGSVGATGMQSKFFENSFAELLNCMGKFSELTLRRALASSSMLSSDVNAAYDPLFANAFDKNNASYFGRGVVFSKFTGSRGKSGSNDANAEYIARIRKMMDDADVTFQTAELGKVDIGGGGTIAYILSLYGMEVIDCGVAVLNMHAPWEITSKADVYEAYKCYKVFLRDA